VEQDWVRQATSVPLALDEANALLAPHGFKASSVRPLTEGKANTNVRLELEIGERAVLRIFQRDKAPQLLEMALMGLFAETLPVARVLAADTAAGWSLYSYLPGRTLQQAAAEAAATEIMAAAPAIGRALATIAGQRFEAAGMLDSDFLVYEPWPSVAGGLEGYLEMCLSRPLLTERVGEDIRQRVRRAWDSARGELEAATRHPNLSHGDFKPSNLLIDEGKLSGVLDWEFAHSGTWLLDAGQLLRHQGELPDGYAAGIEQGLREGGLEPLEGWQRLAGVVDLMSLVDFLGRDACSPATVQHILRLMTANGLSS